MTRSPSSPPIHSVPPALLSVPGIAQIAHVTSDIDRAMVEMGKLFGMGTFLEMRNLDAATRDGKKAGMHVALAYAGDTMVELIQPLGGDDALYRKPLAGGESLMVFHHIARFLGSDEAYDAEIDHLSASGTDFPIRASLADTHGMCRLCYADLRATLGYYVEYIKFSDAARRWLSAIPRY